MFFTLFDFYNYEDSKGIGIFKIRTPDWQRALLYFTWETDWKENFFEVYFAFMAPDLWTTTRKKKGE